MEEHLLKKIGDENGSICLYLSPRRCKNEVLNDPKSRLVTTRLVIRKKQPVPVE